MTKRGGSASPAGGNLRRLLLAAGVGSRWTGRELERVCGKGLDGKPRLSYQTFNRMIRPGEERHDWSPETLKLVAETLRKVGARIDGKPITQGQLTRAWSADYGHAGYVSVTPSDSVEDMIERLPFMAAEDLAKIEAAASAARAAMNRQETSGGDDGTDSHRRSE
ncbi:MAG: hypothetical protein ACREX8_01330 [Gammaproteobacteria bacterium]